MEPTPAQGERSDEYLKVLSFVISNAWKGETLAIENYSDMVGLLPDTESKIEAVKQGKDEAKHVLLLEKLAARLGFAIDPSMVEDEWKAVRDTYIEAVEKRDLAACLIIQDLMIESLAVGIYSTFASEDNGDLETRKVAKLLWADEVEHLDIGLRRIAELSAADAEAVQDSLMWAHNRVMPKLFHMVHAACDFLCTRKGLPCYADKAFVQNGELHLEGERGDLSYIDLNRLKAAALEHYVSMLERAEFPAAVVNPLVAGMAAYEIAGTETGVAEILGVGA